MKIAQETAEYIYNRQISDYPMYVDELESFIAFKINGGKTPKHIKMELDFTPVDEVLPVDSREYLCLIANDHTITTGYRLIDQMLFVGNEWIFEETDESLAKGWFVTHWAEQPRTIAA